MYGFTYRAACPACGRLFDAAASEGHVCAIDPARAVNEFERAFAAWLETPHGRFSVWDAARRRCA
jgi:hypothetical protein